MQYLLFSLFLLCPTSCFTKTPPFNQETLFPESLTPYINQHGSKRSHREIRDCQKKESGALPHEFYPAHQSTNISGPLFKVKQFVKSIGLQLKPRTIRGHVVVVSNPLKTLSVLEPDQIGGCNLNIRQTVAETALKNKCLVAVNAGYFNTKKGSCLGNVISNGKLAHDSRGVQNAHFGLTKDGQIFLGYISQEDVLSGSMKQLVGGVIWILRNGTGYVKNSTVLECEETEETGPMDRFVNILSARSAVGHDNDGNVVFVHVDGKSDVDGINLIEMQELLQRYGVVNAINLDGGGSSTLVVNGVTANYPYDACDSEEFSCDRKVSTILCVHEPYCDPLDCSGHGTCSHGECTCGQKWLPPGCDKLYCAINNCSNNGVCGDEGCVCFPGHYGKNCEQKCPGDWYGPSCAKRCECFNSVGCDPVSGSCICADGFIGQKCNLTCPGGSFGKNCQFPCRCNNSCYCDHVTGACNMPHNSSIYQTANCMAEFIIQDRHLVSSDENQWFQTLVVLGVITSVSVATTLLLLYCSCSCRCRNQQVLCFKQRRDRRLLQVPSGYLSDTASEEEIFPMKSVQGS